MQGKGVVKFFLVILTVICLIQFLFMWPTSRVENSAEEYAQEKVEGIKDPYKKLEMYKVARADYLDSMSSEEIFTIPFIKSYTYSELKQQQLNLGLDLKGGMSVVLQVDLKDFLLTLSGNSDNPKFRQALKNTSEELKSVREDYITVFAQEWAEIAEGEKLASIFSRNSSLRDVINFESTDQQVISVLKKRADEVVDLTFQRLKKRIDKYGVFQPNVSLDKSRDLILVELPGVDNPKRARAYLQASAELEFWHVYRITDQGILAAFIEADNRLAALQGESGKQDTTEAFKVIEVPVLDSLGNVTGEIAYDTIYTDETAAMDSEKGPLLSILNLNRPIGPNQQYSMPLSVVGTAEENKMNAINEMLAMEEIRQLFPSNIKFLWSQDESVNFQTGEKTGLYRLYAIRTIPGKRTAPLEGDHIVDAAMQPDPVTGQVTVSLTMDQRGAQIWADMTTEAARDNQRPIAIVLDGAVVSAPSVNEPIKNGRSSISGNFSVQEGQDLANILKIGKLPAETKIIQESIVGPSLGKENIQKSIISLLVAFLIVVIFMIAYYAGAGIIAIISLFANIFFILGTLSSLGNVLTLPGIAGIVLTMGMAVDANIIIYERVKEELREGKSVRLAIQEGFKHSYSAIIDGNLTTMIVGVILAYFGLGPIKGFAVVLIIGILYTLFTAVLVSQLIITWWLDKGRSITFSNEFSKNLFASMNVDWMKYRKTAYIISGSLLIIFAISIFTKGWEFGVDFKGGRSYDIQFAQDIELDVGDLRKELEEQFDGEPVVKSVDVHNKYNITTAYLIADQSDSADAVVLNHLFAGIEKIVDKDLDKNNFVQMDGTGTHIASISTIGPTIADDIIRSSWISLILALALIFIYILIRFDRWQYSFGGVAALAHDALVMVGLFSILSGWVPFSLEIDQTFIAAILTIIGFSINDTVVIFDRIREIQGKYTGQNKKEIVNEGINSTFSRTIVTALTVFLVVAILFFFGGSSLKGFAFGMMVGVLSGTYSTVFIATALVYDLSGSWTKEAEKSKHKYSKT